MDTREEQKAWLQKVIASTGIAPTTLAQKAGLAPTTLTRFLNSNDYNNALSARTISSVEKFTGIRFSADVAPIGFGEVEATPFDTDENSDLAKRVRSLIGADPVHPWVLSSRALETAGYQPGDILLVDLNAHPAAGDVVCAQLYDFSKMKAETVFRIFEPPYLCSASYDRAHLAPILIDRNVGIKGVVTLSLRPRRHHS